MQQLSIVTPICNGKGRHRSRERGLAGKTTATRVWYDRGTAGIVLVYLCEDLIQLYQNPNGGETTSLESGKV